MEVKKIGNLYGFTGGCYAGNVYDDTGLAPNFNGMEGGNRQPMIVVGSTQKNAYIGNGDYSPSLTSAMGMGGGQIPMIVAMRGRYKDGSGETEQRLEPQKSGLCNTLTGVQKDNMVLIKQATDKGYIECKIGGVADLSFPNSNTRRGRVQDGGDVSPGLTVSGIDGICRIEEPKVLGGIGEKKSNGGTQYFQQDRVYSSDGLAMSHPAQIPGGSYKYMNDYRIRKLTPLECWRLMGFSDDDFHKAEQVNSNTQLYKQAGNSIVVDVLQYIFEEIIKTMEVEEMKKVEEVKTVKFETDKMIDLAKLQEEEPELFDELVADYPCEDATYIYKVQSVG